MTIYVTPYDLITKKCLAASAPSGFDTLAEADKMIRPVTSFPFSESDRLITFNLFGNGMALSDYRFRYEQ